MKKNYGIEVMVLAAVCVLTVLGIPSKIKAQETGKTYYSLEADGGSFDGTHYTKNGEVITNTFFFDGNYTYYLQADGSLMKDRLTYHPDGEHIIYFDTNGHEVFTNFQYCPSVGYTCYFGSDGYIYKDQITFVGDKVYYMDGDGRMRQTGWFLFANGRDYGFANQDGTLNTQGWGYDPYGRVVFYHWNGMVARGLISDGSYYYNMDALDGHYLGAFPVTGSNTGGQVTPNAGMQQVQLEDYGYSIVKSKYNNSYTIYYAVKLNNPNVGYGVEFPSYTVIVKNAAGAILKTDYQTLASIAAGDKSYFGWSLYYDGTDIPVSVEIALDSNEDYNFKTSGEAAIAKLADLPVRNLHVTDGSFPAITGQVINNSTEKQDMIAIVGVFYKNGKIVGGDTTFVDGAVAKGTAHAFELSLPEDLAYDRYEVYALPW